MTRVASGALLVSVASNGYPSDLRRLAACGDRYAQLQFVCACSDYCPDICQGNGRRNVAGAGIEEAAIAMCNCSSDNLSVAANPEAAGAVAGEEVAAVALPAGFRPCWALHPLLSVTSANGPGNCSRPG